MPPRFIGRIVLIHGARFRKKDRNNFRRMSAAFRAAGYNVTLPSYGYLPAFLIGIFQWLDFRIAESISAFIDEDDILIGHSNGATLVYLVSQFIPVQGAVLINAALDSTKLPDADFVHVYYNEGDWTATLSGMIPFHVWGNMGAVGYNGPPASHVTNIDQGNPPANLPPLKGHSDFFKGANLRRWSRYIADQCLKASHAKRN